MLDLVCRFQLHSTVAAPSRTAAEDSQRGGYDGNGKEAGSNMSESKKDQVHKIQSFENAERMHILVVFVYFLSCRKFVLGKS